MPYASSSLAWLSFRKLLRHRRDSAVYYEKKRLEYKRGNKSRDELAELDMEEYVDHTFLDDEINRARSNRLLEECIQRDIEIPQEQEFWEKSVVDRSTNYLSSRARAHLRNLIREEKAKSSQELSRLIPFLTAIGSIIALLIGLVSVLKK
jgi:hypothetical protein